MSLQLPNIPSLSTKVDSEVRRAFDALKGWLNKASTGGGVVTRETLAGDMAENPELTALFDGTTPPQITGFTVTGAFAKIMLEWDDLHYLYLSHVEVYRNTVDDLGTAQKIGTTIATVYADAPPNSSASVDYYYWVRGISKAKIIGPYNATAGTVGRTALDPTYALQVLSGQLTTSELHNDLNSRINLIDQDNTGLVSLLSNLAISTSDLIVAEAERWERLLFEKMVTDATVEVAPTAYCTLSAYTSEATCVAGGGVWRPAGTIRLKATADITTDVEAAVRTVTSELNAMAGTLTDTVSAVTAHGQNIIDYLTGTNSVISQLNGAIQQRVSTEYVDLKTDAIANAADVATYASEMNIPESLAYLILHNDDARRKLRGNTAHIATAQQDILTNADAIEAEAIARLALTATVDDHYASLLEEQTARADADSAEATARLLLNSKVEDNQAALESNYYTKTDTDMAIAGWSDRAIAISNNNTASVITNYYTKAQVDSASAGWFDSAVSEANGHAATLLEDYSSTVDMNTAIATSESTLQTQINGNTASVQTLASSVNGLSAEWTIKTDVNGNVAGIGLMNEDGLSRFIISVNEHAVARPVQFTGIGMTPVDAGHAPAESDEWAKPDGTVWKYLSGVWVKQAGHAIPLCVLTTPQTINGVTMPAGVYIDGASIGHETVGNSQIANLAVDSAKIAIAAVGAEQLGNLAVTDAKIGNTISSGYLDSAGNFISTFNASTGQGWQIKKDGGIDCANLTIRNPNGTILLQSGGALDYSLVGGTKPPSNADRTASNTAAGIAGQGSFATLSQITGANVTTYIADAALKTAQIGTAQVTSLLIKDEAVTLSVAGSKDSEQQGTGAWAEYFHISVANTDSPVPLTVNIVATLTAKANWREQTGSFSYAKVQWRLVNAAGTVLFGPLVIAEATSNLLEGNYLFGSSSRVIKATISAGASDTYTLQIYESHTGYGYCAGYAVYGSLLAIGGKR